MLPWVAVLAWMGLIFMLSAQSGLRVSADAEVDRPLRSLAHVVTYGILAALLLGALRASGSSVRASLAGAVMLAVLYGVSDEVHQAFVPDRTGQVGDVLLDAVGAALGAGAGVLLLRRRERRRANPAEGVAPGGRAEPGGRTQRR